MSHDFLDEESAKPPLGFKAVAAGGAHPSVDPGPAGVPGDLISEAQWLIYFCFELACVAPQYARSRAFELATAARALARHVIPEHAAASFAIGMSAAALS